MKKKHLNDEGNALRAQKHQVNNAEDKLSEIDSILSNLQEEQSSSDDLLDNILDDIEEVLKNNSAEVPEHILTENLSAIENELNVNENIEKPPIISEINSIQIDDNSTWEEYTNLVEDYGFKNNLNLQEDPFKHIMTKSQQVALQKRIKEDFTLQNANCDKYDYMIAGACGVIGGLIDILFVGSSLSSKPGTPGDSKLGKIADEHANKATEKFAEFLGWPKNKAIDKGKNTTASAIGYLENLGGNEEFKEKYNLNINAKINYDQATTSATKGAVKNLSMSNHHLKSLGHSPDLIGLFFSILNQFTSTSSFINNGQIITIKTETFELQGNDFIAKIFCGFANWFIHIMSDWTGSSGTVGNGGRGTGVPIPFYNLLQLLNFGRFGEKDRETFATVTSKVFEGGYDFRHGMAMAIPVVITELLIRLMWSIKSRFYHGNSWKDSIPDANIPELRRMLLIGHGTLCIIDGADAYIRSGGEMVTFLSRTNLLAWVRFGQLGLKELNAWYNAGHIDADAVDKYLETEYKQMLKLNK